MNNFNEFDLVGIFKSVWGYAPAPFLFTSQNNVEKRILGQKSEFSEYSFEQPSERREKNIQGSPFYALNHNGNEVFLPIWLIDSFGVEFMLQNTVSSIVSKKTIVETQLVNQQGSVKEEISIDDWEINVKGIIVSPDMDYPDQQVQDLVKLYELSDSLGIDNARTSVCLQKGEKVVIKSLKFPELKGMKNLQPFEMDLVSDVEFTLFIQ